MVVVCGGRRLLAISWQLIAPPSGAMLLWRATQTRISSTNPRPVPLIPQLLSGWFPGYPAERSRQLSACLVWEGYCDLRSEIRTSPTIVNGLGRELHVFRGPLELALESVEDHPSGRLPVNWLPLDGAWCVANDIYARSVFLGGSVALIAEVLSDPELEAHSIRPNHMFVPED